MAIFGFGKKKTDDKKPDEPAVAAPQVKTGVSPAVKRPQPKAPAASGSGISARLRQPAAPGAVKRPSLAVQPKKAEAAAPKPGIPAPDDSMRKVRKSTDNKQLGQLLIKDGKINQQQLTRALTQQQQNGGLLGQILTKMEVCSKADVAGALKKQRTITTVNLSGTDFDRDALALLKREFCEKNRLIPFELTGTQLCVAMSNALDTTAKNEVKELTQMHIKIFDAAHDDIQTAIKTYMSGDASAPAAPQVSLAEAAKQEQEPDPAQIVIELPDEALVVEEPAPAAAAPALPEIPAVDLEIPALSAEDIIPIEEEAPAPQPAAKPAPAAVKPAHPAHPAPQAATIHASLPAHETSGGDIPSIPDISEIEHIDESALFSYHAPQPVFTGQMLTALPIKPALANRIVRGGKVDPLRLWEATHSGEFPVPAILPI